MLIAKRIAEQPHNAQASTIEDQIVGFLKDPIKMGKALDIFNLQVKRFWTRSPDLDRHPKAWRTSSACLVYESKEKIIIFVLDTRSMYNLLVLVREGRLNEINLRAALRKKYPAKVAVSLSHKSNLTAHLVGYI